jgi:NADH-quinone oxidoreductase subunit N
VPDAAQGANSTAATFLTTVPKIGALVAAYRLVSVLPDTVAWPLLVAVLATASMTLGNLAAYGQRDPRRLLGWSTVSQVGYLLVPIAAAGRSELALPSLLLYLTVYTVTNIAAFAVAGALPDRRDLGAYLGLSRSSPLLAAAVVVALLGLVGTPPTGVFVGKLTTATAAWDAGMAWLTVAVLVNSVASLFYYLSWIAPVFRALDRGEGKTVVPHRPWSTWTAVGTATLSLALGVAGGVVWQIADGRLVS